MTHQENASISNDASAAAAEPVQPKADPRRATEPAAVKPSLLWIVVPIVLIAVALFLAR